MNYSSIDWFNSIFISPIAFQFCFIRDLMFLVVLTPLLYKLIKFFNYYLISMFIVAWFCNFSFFIFTSQSLLFFSLGTLFSLNKLNLNNLLLKKYDLLFYFLWVFCVVFHRVVIYNEIVKNTILLNSIHKIGVVFGILSLWLAYDRIVKDRDVLKIKFFNIFSFSFFLFAFHEPFGTLLEYGLYFILGNTQLSSFIIYIVSPIILIGSSVFIGFHLKKNTPKFYAIITGGR